MMSSTYSLMQDMIDEWNPQIYSHDLVFLYGGNAYVLCLNSIQIYFPEFIIVAGMNGFECYDRAIVRQFDIPKFITNGSIDKKIRELFEQIYDAQIFIGNISNRQIFAMLKK